MNSFKMSSKRSDSQEEQHSGGLCPPSAQGEPNGPGGRLSLVLSVFLGQACASPFAFPERLPLLHSVLQRLWGALWGALRRAVWHPSPEVGSMPVPGCTMPVCS